MPPLAFGGGWRWAVSQNFVQENVKDNAGNNGEEPANGKPEWRNDVVSSVL